MKRLSSVAGSLAGISFVFVAGCGPSPHDMAVQDAHSAAARGDLATAAKRYTEACKLEADDRESCAQAVRTTDAYGAVVMARAQAPCEAGDAVACAATFAEYRELRPTDVRMRELLGRAAAAYVEKCEALEKPGSVNSLLARAKCAMGVQNQLHDARYDRLIESEREHAAIGLVQAAESGAASAAASPAAKLGPASRYALLEMARCLWSKTTGANSREAAQTFVTAASLPISAQASFRSGMSVGFDLCGSAAQALGPRVHCIQKAEPGLSVDMKLELSDTHHEIAQEPRSARYVARTETYPNPNRTSVEREYYSAKGAFEQVEQDTRDRQAVCQRTRDRAACDAYNSAQSVYDRRKSELASAQSRLQATPPTLTRDVYADAHYVILHHSWATPFAAVAYFGDSTQFTDKNVFQDQDDETAGAPVAGIAADPLQAPVRATYENELRKRALALATSQFAGRLAARATCSNQAWDFDSPALECKARSAFLTSSQIPEAPSWMNGLQCR